MLSETNLKKLKEILQSAPAADAEVEIQVLQPRSDERLPNGRYPYQQIVASKIDHMQEYNLNLLVASPTGSGKTFAIEYAAQWASQENYTLCIAQPLIALAAEVYFKLLKSLDESLVMLKTGPIVKGEIDDAKILVCTYEVLARIASDRSEVFTSCKIVIIDEIHCIENDRGPVILEILNECRDKNIIALSGTLPNKVEFAKFLSSINENITYITGARDRPVALNYFFYNVCRQRCSTLRSTEDAHEVDPKVIGGLNKKQDLLSCIRCLQSHNSAPMLFVMFSIKKLDQMADWASCLDFSNSWIRSRVTVMFNSMLSSVPEEDHCLFDDLKMLALKGIGKHHSHLPVPYLELVCALAEKRLISVVFSSSTLSAGINLPVKTLVLCGAYIPRKTSTGSMIHETLSSLLFHQLAGRAGRPQFEKNGYVVIVGKDDNSYKSAQALVKRPLQYIRPCTELCVGDVMRGMRQRRDLSHEQAHFMDPGLKNKINFTNSIQYEIERIYPELSDKSMWDKATQVFKAGNIIIENAACLPWARVQDENELFLVVDASGEMSTTAELPETASGMWKASLTTKSEAAKKYPVQHFDEILRTKAAIKVLLDAQDCDKGLWLLASVMKLKAYWESFSLHHESAAHVHQLCQEIPQMFKNSPNVLNSLGLAACEIRAVKNPCIVVQALLCSGTMNADSLIEFCSCVLGDGIANQESNDEEQHIYSKFPVLRALPAITETKITRAVTSWANGSNLYTITSSEDACSVGVLCRHLLRVSDLLQEMKESSSILGTLDLIPNIEQALSKIKRGLPFLRRSEY